MEGITVVVAGGMDQHSHVVFGAAEVSPRCPGSRTSCLFTVNVSKSGTSAMKAVTPSEGWTGAGLPRGRYRARLSTSSECIVRWRRYRNMAGQSADAVNTSMPTPDRVEVLLACCWVPFSGMQARRSRLIRRQSSPLTEGK